MKALTRTIVLLSFVSLFTDVASEMLYPITPIYLESLGYSILFIGLLEGFAEAIASISKGYFGKLSDITGKRVLFVRFGYSLSAISKPLIGFIINPVWVFVMRGLDRVGKGIRTAPRDALLSQESLVADRGKVFGFHRGMDTVGAAIGPALAMIFLFFYPGKYRALFLYSIFPGIIAIVLTLLLKDKQNKNTAGTVKMKRVNFFAQFSYWRNSPKEYKILVFLLLIFTLMNSSDVFLLLKMKNSGHGDFMVIGLYVFYNLVYALTSYPAGRAGDKFGFKIMLLAGMACFSLVYTAMAFTTNPYLYVFLFFIYGLYYALSEGISKAWLSKLCRQEDMGTAIGLFTGLQGICTLIASILAAIFWRYISPSAPFIISGIAAFILVVFMAVNRKLGIAG
jgi:MFS family permease